MILESYQRRERRSRLASVAKCLATFVAGVAVMPAIAVGIVALGDRFVR